MLRQTQNIYTNKDERACSKRDKQQNKRKQLTYQSLYAGGLKSKLYKLTLDARRT